MKIINILTGLIIVLIFSILVIYYKKDTEIAMLKNENTVLKERIESRDYRRDSEFQQRITHLRWNIKMYYHENGEYPDINFVQKLVFPNLYMQGSVKVVDQSPMEEHHNYNFRQADAPHSGWVYIREIGSLRPIVQEYYISRLNPQYVSEPIIIPNLIQ